MPRSRPPAHRPPATAVDEVRYLVLAAQREGSRMLAESLRALNLTPAQAEVLEVVRDRGPLTLAELGRLLVCEAGSPSRLVDALVRRDLVARAPGVHDRRVVTLTLTESGRAAVTAAAGIETIRAHITERLTAPELDRLAALLRRLVAGSPAGSALAARYPSSPSDQDVPEDAEPGSVDVSR
jgi:DNA-binding MarR family transcriptional regulator